LGVITFREAFEKSSNVGISKLVKENYEKRPSDFVDRLYRLGLNQKLGLEIKGEGAPDIKYTDSPLWSKLSLPMMSIGYEVRQTPLQVLAFYNAIANDGEMVKPLFVEEIRYQQESDWVKTMSTQEGVLLRRTDISGLYVPDVKDMGARDAVFLLENMGLRTEINGRGTVHSQDPPPGTLLRKGDHVTLKMSITEG
jgi:cell division protein FtsI (penicillin-binding protein 3)